MQTFPVHFGGQQLLLTTERAIFMQNTQALILSDMHLGKAAHFRKHGIAIPAQIHESDLNRLAALIQHFEPKSVYIVGDFVHAQSNNEVLQWKDFVTQYPSVDFHLILGNHDRLHNDFLYSLGFQSVQQKVEHNTILLIHEPIHQTAQNVICGHIHPGVQIKLPTRKSIKLPCYVLTENTIYLPAFSLFTGLDTRTIHPDAQIIAFDQQQFFQF